MRSILIVFAALGFLAITVSAQKAPREASRSSALYSPQDRIAVSSDGNLHDADDISATAATLALLAAVGDQSKLVYYGYSDHIWDEPAVLHRKQGKSGAERMEEVIAKSIEVYQYNSTVFYDVYKECRRPGASFTQNRALEALKKAIAASSAQSRLWIIQAGPLEVIATALRQSEARFFPHLVLVSHSQWNNGHAHGKHGATSWVEMKKNFLEQGGVIHSGAGGAKAGQHPPQFDRPRDQNGILKHKPEVPFEGLSTEYLGKDKMKPWEWLRDHSDPRFSLMWEAHQLGRPGDISDAGMLYYVLTGDDETSAAKFRSFIEKGFAQRQ